MKNYLINKNTIVLYEKNNRSIIYEKNKNFIINKCIIDLINESCNYYCSSFKGRIEGSTYLLGNNYKTPIIISENLEIILFPTTSYKAIDCVWINYNYIDKYYAEDDKTVIVFKNKKKITINIPNKIINKQILKSSRLESILKSKKQ